MTSNNELNKKIMIEEDDINYHAIISFFLRNRIVISLSSLFFFIAGCIYALSIKPTWQGSFQIVLSGEQKEAGGLKDLILATGSKGGKQDLLTEVEKIKSPSVLMPIFSYVKEYKNKNSKLSFNNWRNQNLDITLIKRTSVVNLDYKDKKKDIIIPVLNKISNAYQDYSGKQRKTELDTSIVFLNEQIEKYAKRSLDSSTKAKDYAVKHTLSFLNNDNDVVNIEVKRLSSAEQIEKIENQIRKVNNLENVEESFSYLSPFSQDFGSLILNLEIDFAKLQQNRDIYREDDKEVILLKRKIKTNIDLLKNYVLISLKNSLEVATEEYKSTERPVEILTKYKELKNKANLDLKTLNSLQTDLRSVIIERAKAVQPWELISNPTLMDYPIEPQKKKIALFSLLIGFVSSSFILYLKEINKDIIFDKKKLELLIGHKMLLDLEKNNSDKTENDIQSILRFLNENKGIGFITLGDIDSQEINDFKKYFEDKNESIKDRFIKNDLTNEKFKSCILLLSLGSIKKKDILAFKKRCTLNSLTIKGFFNLHKD